MFCRKVSLCPVNPNNSLLNVIASLAPSRLSWIIKSKSYLQIWALKNWERFQHKFLNHFNIKTAFLLKIGIILPLQTPLEMEPPQPYYGLKIFKTITNKVQEGVVGILHLNYLPRLLSHFIVEQKPCNGKVLKSSETPLKSFPNRKDGIEDILM